MKAIYTWYMEILTKTKTSADKVIMRNVITMGHHAFPVAAAMSGTLCRLSSEMNSQWWPFDGNSRQYSSGHPLARMLIPEPRHC